MPIAYTCPHCGKQFTVAEQYAGQTGPCAACGQTITIPLAAPGTGYAYAPQAGAAGAAGAGILVVVIAIIGSLVICGGILLALLLPAFSAAQEAARRAQASNNLKQIGLALHNYHDTYNSFPPAVVTDANGKPLYSGRVLLLPFLEQNAIYSQFDLTQPWDSSQNMPLAQISIAQFMDPSAKPAPGQTDFLFVSGKGTIFEAGQTSRLRDILDGTSNTLMLIEVKNSGISWTEPKDIDLTQAAALPAGNHPGGNIAITADGAVRFLSKNIAPATLQGLTTKAGGEMINP
jgi:hypothetical protein